MDTEQVLSTYPVDCFERNASGEAIISPERTTSELIDAPSGTRLDEQCCLGKTEG